MSNEDFRRELGSVFDEMTGSPSAALPDRVRSSLANVPEQRGPYWIAGVAAAVIAVIVIGVLVVANPLNRPTNSAGPVVGSTPTPNATPSASPSSTPTPDTNLPPFVCASSTTIPGQAAPPSAFIDDLRAGTHAGYDRLTIQFQNGQPQSIQLQPQPHAKFTRDGIGDTVQLAGDDGILVTIFSGDAHTAYSGSTDIKTGYTGLLEVRVVGDFEGYVHIGLGLSKPACYRAFILPNPTRLVVDIQTG